MSKESNLKKIESLLDEFQKTKSISLYDLEQQISPLLSSKEICKYILEKRWAEIICIFPGGDFRYKKEQAKPNHIKWLEEIRDATYALFHNSSIGDLEGVKKACEDGACINAKDATGKTPLYYVMVGGYEDIKKYLTAKGAKVNEEKIKRRFFRFSKLGLLYECSIILMSIAIALALAHFSIPLAYASLLITPIFNLAYNTYNNKYNPNVGYEGSKFQDVIWNRAIFPGRLCFVEEISSVNTMLEKTKIKGIERG